MTNDFLYGRICLDGYSWPDEHRRLLFAKHWDWFLGSLLWLNSRCSPLLLLAKSFLSHDLFKALYCYILNGGVTLSIGYSGLYLQKT